MKRSTWLPAVLGSALLAFPVVAAHAQDGGGGGMQGGGQRGMGGGGRRGGGVRGTVTAVSGANVTVKNDAGETWTIVTTDNTRVRRDGQAAAVGGIQQGDELMAMGIPDADKHEVHAMVVMDASAAAVAKARADLGKTYIVGRITAIHDTQLTIERPDKVAQTITLDDTTSLKKGGRPSPAMMQAMGAESGMAGMGMGGGRGMRGGRQGAEGQQGGDGAQNDDAAGQSITLADVKAGDSVVGIGSIKGGSFVPTELRVQDRPTGPSQFRRGRPGMATQDGTTPVTPQP